MQTPVIPDPTTTPTLSVDETALLLGVSRGSAYKAIRDNEIPHFKIGKRILVPTNQVLAILGFQAPAGDRNDNI
jgi:excisionase family DNA binding protein